jgi:hypothetical protein
MGLLIGPTPWWQQNVVSAVPVGTSLPDGSRLICKAGGTAWIVAPASTQVCSRWGTAPNAQVGVQCCVCAWPTLQTQLINCGFNPIDWFVPTSAQMQNPGYTCRTQWDSFTSGFYWSSTEQVGGDPTNNACRMDFANIGNSGACQNKNCPYHVRAFRCVTY